MSNEVGVITQYHYGIVTDNIISVAVVSSGLTINNITVNDGIYYQHDQSSALSTWTVNHNLGKNPNITVYSVGSVKVDAEVIHISINQAQVIFDFPYSGFAICS